MRISKVRLYFKNVLYVVILYVICDIVVYFHKSPYEEIFSKENFPENGVIKKISSTDINKRILSNITRTTIKEPPSVSMKPNKNKHVKSWRKIVKLKDEIFPEGVKNYFNHPLDTINYYHKYTQGDPKTYKGAFLDHWPPSKSRSIVPYMNEPFTIVPKKSRLHNKTLIAIVQSIPSEFEIRNIWRRTWGKYANKETSILFLLGKSNNIHKEKDPKLLEEHRKYGDIIQIDGLIEHYSNLTFKFSLILSSSLNDNIRPLL